MLQSLRDYISLLGKAVWVWIIGLLGGVTGAFLDLGGYVDLVILRIIWIFAFFVGLVVIPIYGIHKMRQRTEKVLENQPIIKASTIQKNFLSGEVYIDIMNDGAFGIFKVNINIENPDIDTALLCDTSWQSYNGCWREENNCAIPIMKGESKRLILGIYKQTSLGRELILHKNKVNVPIKLGIMNYWVTIPPSEPKILILKASVFTEPPAQNIPFTIKVEITDSGSVSSQQLGFCTEH